MNLPPEVSIPIAEDIMKALRKYTVLRDALDSISKEAQDVIENDIRFIVEYLGA